ncbi:putative G-protein coupled receptor 160 [Labeo rohita]|uniref:Putative G-protein coupled receptor 160 n=1 Tax=Labeo rohita TaxID=84645 RepID=A0A498LVW7_LABRO|nr:probable G-protein coupled receptor 160 [Labeo rohita]XP_050972381.1 probable G-protein coupled receptor 160 [Labeo rohita]RXN12628.1 putative G-protein coupled receptor 160 [Labeo rohita]
MSNQHASSVIMMAVIWSPGTNKNFPHDETLQYLLILCFKVALNTFVLFFWRLSIFKSFLGLCSVTMYVADVLLVSAVMNAWLFKEHLPTSTSMCFILAHGSAVYALLPLPILIVGAFDYASYPHLDTSSSTRCRAVSYSIVIVLLWALACCYTYNYTDTQPMETYKDNMRVLACRVHGSSVVFQFSIHLSIAVGFILLLYFKKKIGWTRKANKLAELKNTAFAPEKDQNFLCAQAGEGGNSEIPLFVSLTLCFASNWMPYLLMGFACALVGFVVPAYASVNLLWMACANSVLVAIAFWFRSDSIGPLRKFPDDTCLWNIYWHLSKGTSPTVDAKLTTKLYIRVHKPTVPFQEI